MFAKVPILKRRESPDPTFNLCGAIVYIQVTLTVVNMAASPVKRKLPGTDGNNSIEKLQMSQQDVTSTSASLGFRVQIRDRHMRIVCTAAARPTFPFDCAQ